jgi:hypothetical protein
MIRIKTAHFLTTTCALQPFNYVIGCLETIYETIYVSFTDIERNKISALLNFIVKYEVNGMS